MRFTPGGSCCCQIYDQTFTAFDASAFSVVSGSAPTVTGGKLRIDNSFILFNCRARKVSYDFGTGYYARPVSVYMSGITLPTASEVLKIYTRYSDSNNCDYIELSRENYVRYVAVVSGSPTVVSEAIHYGYQTTYEKVDNPDSGNYDHSGGGTYSGSTPREFESYLDGREIDIEFRISEPSDRASPASCNGYSNGTVTLRVHASGFDSFVHSFALFTVAGNHVGTGYWGIEHSGSDYCDIEALTVYSTDDPALVSSVNPCRHEQTGTGMPGYSVKSGWPGLGGSLPSYVDESIIDGKFKSSYTLELSGIPNPSDVNYTLARDGMDCLNATHVMQRFCGTITNGPGGEYFIARADGCGMTLTLNFPGGRAYIDLYIDSLDSYSVYKKRIINVPFVLFDTWADRGTTAYLFGSIPLCDNDGDFNCNSPSINPYTLDTSMSDGVLAGLTGSDMYPYLDATHNWDGMDAVLTI